MGLALVVDVGTVANPSTTITACVAGTGSTFTVRNFSLSSTARLIDAWRDGATAGIVRVRSPKFADNVQGIRVACAAGLDDFLLVPEFGQNLTAQDTLTVEVTGGASENDSAAIQTYYDDLSGADMTLKMPGDISGSYQYLDSWEVNTTSGGTIGNYGSTAITNLYDVSQANSWYAVLGYVVDTKLTAVALQGADTSNLNVGGPGDITPFRTRRYFVDLSERLGKPCIPMFNTANKGNTTIQTAAITASVTSNVTLIVAIMPEGYTP